MYKMIWKIWIDFQDFSAKSTGTGALSHGGGRSKDRFVFQFPCADARAVRPYMPLVNNPFYHSANHKVQSSNFKIQSSKSQRSKFNVQTSKSKPLHACCGHSTIQFQPFRRVISLILPCEITHFSVRNGCEWSARRKLLIAIWLHVGTHGPCVRPTNPA